MGCSTPAADPSYAAPETQPHPLAISHSLPPAPTPPTNEPPPTPSTVQLPSGAALLQQQQQQQQHQYPYGGMQGYPGGAYGLPQMAGYGYEPQSETQATDLGRAGGLNMVSLGRWEIGDWRWEIGDWRWEMGGGRCEVGGRRLEIGDWRLAKIVQRCQRPARLAKRPIIRAARRFAG